MNRIFENILADLSKLGLEFKMIPNIVLTGSNDKEIQPASKKFKKSHSDFDDTYASKQNVSKDVSYFSKLKKNNECTLCIHDISTSNNIDKFSSIYKETKTELKFSQSDEKYYAPNGDKIFKEVFEEINEDLILLVKPSDKWFISLKQDASDMLDENDFPNEKLYPSITERYLTPYYQINALGPADDICILIHSNCMCMITLAPSHFIFKENKKIEKISFKVSEKLDRTLNKLSGKSKHGAQPLQTNSNLCNINFCDGTKYIMKCGMIGKLVEVNEKLTNFPDMLKLEPHYGGYIAIVLPNLKHLEILKCKLINKNHYEEIIKKTAY